MKLDVLIFAAHPDDAELSMGGTIAKLTRSGAKIGIVDFTKGELGTRGTPELREEEADKASAILGVAERVNLNFPDGRLFVKEEYVTQAIVMIRKYRPKIIFAPFFNDRHPDHIEASRIVKKAMFLSGLPLIKTELDEQEQQPYRAEKLFYYMHMYEFAPSFVSDISETFEIKMKAVMAYASQFYDPASKEPETFISKPHFLEFLKARAVNYGFKIGKDFGEPFYCEEEIELDLSCMLNEIK